MLFDSLGILNRQHCFIGQANNVVCWFGKLDYITKTRLLKAYCSSFYGSELWDFANVNVSSVCKSWRRALRRVWKVSFNCHTAIINALSNSISIFDILRKKNFEVYQELFGFWQ